MNSRFKIETNAQHLDEKAAAEVIGVAYRTLQDWRLAGIGPAYRRLGRRRIIYVMSDIIEWSDKNKHQNTSSEKTTTKGADLDLLKIISQATRILIQLQIAIREAEETLDKRVNR